MRTRALIGLTAIAVVLLATLAPAGAQPGRQQDEASFIVVLAPGADVPADSARLAAEHGGQAVQLFEAVLGGFQFTGPSSAAAGLARSPKVQAVVPDESFSLVDVASWGFWRIDADASFSDPDGPYRGANTRIAVIDSGIDTDHPDLAPNLDLANSYNCQSPGAPPEDDNGHGTHVSGTAAAAFADGYGAVGVAPEASIVALKAFDASGSAATSHILCALDRLATVTTNSPVPTAVNMSFADVGTDSVCDDAGTDVLHEAICDVVDAGQTATPAVPVIPVAAAGNADANAGSTIPAAYHDVITVSALADFDGLRGGAKGCVYVELAFNYECDDTIASFSNWGTAVDLMAPGVNIWSTVPGGHGLNSGTSMAAPHVTGVAAVVLGEHASLDTAGMRSLLLATGECPDGSEAGADESCSGQGAWRKTRNRSIFDPVGTEADPDGVAEPVVNAGRAAARADELGDPPVPPPPPPADEPPTVAISSPAGGATASGTETISGIADDDNAVAQVEVFVDQGSIGTAALGGGGWSLEWDTTLVPNGSHTITAVATDNADQTTSSAEVVVTVDNPVPPPPPQATMHVGELVDAASIQGRKWTAEVGIRVVDPGGGPVEGATVTVTFQSASAASLAGKGGVPGSGGGGGPDGTNGGTLSCVTDVEGWCSVSTKPSADSVRFVVTGLAKAGWDHDVEADVDHDTSTTETDIVVTRPAG